MHRSEDLENLVHHLKFALVLIPIIIVILLYFFCPGDSQINLNTGEIRYRICRFSYHFDDPPQYKHEWSLLHMPNSWQTISTSQNVGLNDPNTQVKEYIYAISIWEKYDKAIARDLANDLVDYIIQYHFISGLPKYSIFYSSRFVNIRDGKLYDRFSKDQLNGLLHRQL